MLSIATTTTQKVVGKTTEGGQWIFYPSDEHFVLENEEYQPGETIQIISVEENELADEYFLKCQTEYGIRYIAIDNADQFEIQKIEKKTKTSKPKKVEHVETGEHSRKVRITCYCKACNGGGGLQTASGKRPQALKTCAFNGVPFGTVIRTSYGDFVVNDRCGSKKCLDIYIGDYDKCHCSRAGYYGTEIVYWG